MKYEQTYMKGLLTLCQIAQLNETIHIITCQLYRLIDTGTNMPIRILYVMGRIEECETEM